jgi:hypothetical protein
MDGFSWNLVFEYFWRPRFPPARMKHIGFHWSDFHEIWSFSISENLAFCPPEWNISVSTGRIFMKFNVWVFLKTSLSARTNETTRFPLYGFSWNLIFEYYFWKPPLKSKIIKFTLHALYREVKIPQPLFQDAVTIRTSSSTFSFSLYSYEKDERVKPGNLMTKWFCHWPLYKSVSPTTPLLFTCSQHCNSIHGIV